MESASWQEIEAVSLSLSEMELMITEARNSGAPADSMHRRLDSDSAARERRRRMQERREEGVEEEEEMSLWICGLLMGGLGVGKRSMP